MLPSSWFIYEIARVNWSQLSTPDYRTVSQRYDRLDI